MRILILAILLGIFASPTVGAEKEKSEICFVVMGLREIGKDFNRFVDGLHNTLKLEAKKCKAGDIVIFRLTVIEKSTGSFLYAFAPRVCDYRMQILYSQNEFGDQLSCQYVGYLRKARAPIGSLKWGRSGSTE